MPHCTVNNGAWLLTSRCYVDEPNSCPDAKPSSWGASYAWSCQACRNRGGLPSPPDQPDPSGHTYKGEYLCLDMNSFSTILHSQDVWQKEPTLTVVETLHRDGHFDLKVLQTVQGSAEEIEIAKPGLCALTTTSAGWRPPVKEPHQTRTGYGVYLAIKGRSRNAPWRTEPTSMVVETLKEAYHEALEVNKTVQGNALRISPVRRGPCARTTNSAGLRPQVRGQLPARTGCGDCHAVQGEVSFLNKMNIKKSNHMYRASQKKKKIRIFQQDKSKH